MTSELTAHLTTGAVVVYAIEQLKKSKRFPWIDKNTTTLIRLLNVSTAFAVSIGINYHYDTANRDLTIHIPMAAVLVDQLWEWAKQLVTQQIIYDSAIAGKDLTVHFNPVTGKEDKNDSIS